MRALLLILIILGICGLALPIPIVGLYGYVWFALLRPDVLAWADDGRFPYSMALATVTCFGLLQYSERIRILFASPVCRTLLILQVPILLSIVLAIRPELCLEALNQYSRVIFMALVIPVYIGTQTELRRLLLIMTMSLGVLGTKFGLFGVLKGGVHLAQGYGGLLADNNDLALAFVMTIPLCWHLRSSVPWKSLRIVMVGMIFCMMAAIVMTHSRGGAIALVVTLVMLAMRSKRKVPALILFALLVWPSVYMVQDSYFERLATLQNPEEEGSANARILLAKAAFAMWQDYPLFGVGFGGDNFASIVSSYLGWKKAAVAHNTYLQLLADCGIFAFLIYCGLLFGTIRALGRWAKMARPVNPEMAAFAIAMQTSLIGFAVGSTFLSRIQFDFYYMLLMTAAAWREIFLADMANRERDNEADLREIAEEATV